MTSAIHEVALDLDARLRRMEASLDALRTEVSGARSSLATLLGSLEQDGGATRADELLARWNAATPDGEEAPLGDTISSVADRMLGLAIGPDGDAAFQEFIALFHSDDAETLTAVHSVKSYTWPQIRKNGESYLTRPGDPTSFRLVRRDPEEPEPSGDRAKWYFWSARRSPAPVSFRRDAKCGGRWRVTQCSL